MLMAELAAFSGIEITGNHIKLFYARLMQFFRYINEKYALKKMVVFNTGKFKNNIFADK